MEIYCKRDENECRNVINDLNATNLRNYKLRKNLEELKDGLHSVKPEVFRGGKSVETPAIMKYKDMKHASGRCYVDKYECSNRRVDLSLAKDYELELKTAIEKIHQLIFNYKH